MELRKVEWQERGYHLMLVEARPCHFNLLVSRDRQEYAIYDRFHSPNIRVARESIRFNPYFYEAVPPAFRLLGKRPWLARRVSRTTWKS